MLFVSSLCSFQGASPVEASSSSCFNYASRYPSEPTTASRAFQRSLRMNSLTVFVSGFSAFRFLSFPLCLSASLPFLFGFDPSKRYRNQSFCCQTPLTCWPTIFSTPCVVVADVLHRLCRSFRLPAVRFRTVDLGYGSFFTHHFSLERR